MELNFYKAYKNSLAQKPVDSWRNLMQQAISETWEDTSTIEILSGQSTIGGTSFAQEHLQVTSVVSPKTGKVLGDDFRKIIYKNLFDNELPPNIIKTSQFLVNRVGNVELYKFKTIEGEDFLVRNSNRWLGKYYRFKGYTWLTINTNTIIGAAATAILQRCNNWLKWYDADGTFHQWECVFDRALSSTGFDFGSENVPEISSDIVIKVQRNAETDSISFNQKFVFDGHVFQVKQINNHISETYMELYLFETQIQANDNLVDGIANNPIPSVEMQNNIVISPNIQKINLGETQKFSVFNYVNGVPTDDGFDISLSGPKQGLDYELLIIDKNNFSIKNLKQSNTPLSITFSNINNVEQNCTINILLGGKW